MQNEFSLEENIALARQFLLDNFVSRGMTVDVEFHGKETEEGGTPNPHFHFLCPIRPMNPDGNRIRDQNGKFLFDAVATTDWGDPETLERWREAWADVCNAKFVEKGLDLLPTVHEGSFVWAMEKKGIHTEKGEFNRWIKATNAVIRDIRGKIAVLLDWIKEAKTELDRTKPPDRASLLISYYDERKSNAYSRKGKVSNLKQMSATFCYLGENGITTLKVLESRVQSHQTTVDSLKATLDSQSARMKAIRSLSDDHETVKRLKPIFDGLQKIKFDKPRAAYKAEHQAELKQFYAARRRLSQEYSTLEQSHSETYAQFKAIREDLQQLWSVKSKVDTARRLHQRTEGEKLQNQPQTRHDKTDIDR